MKIFFFILLFTTSISYAGPKHIEIWFVSAAKVVNAIDLLFPSIKYGPLKAQSGRLCEKVGDYCFDPQIGLYKPEGDDFQKVDIPDEKLPQLPTAKSVDRNMINCDQNYKFDMFCGSAKKLPTQKAKLEIWIDTSSSMKEMDFSDKDGSCYRKSFMKRLDNSCSFPSKVSLSTFDTSIREVGDFDSLCINQGLNDENRMLDWIERSTADTLIVITDVYELHKSVVDYVEEKHGKIRGEKENFTMKQALDLVDDVAKFCR